MRSGRVTSLSDAVSEGVEYAIFKNGRKDNWVRAFASFILRGRLQAILVATVCAALTLMVPPINIVTGAVVALVTLRKGAQEGLLVIVGTCVVSALLAFASTQNTGLFVTFLVSLGIAVLPVWILALVLRNTVSLGTTLSVAVIVAAVAVIGMHIAVADPAAWWEEVLMTAFQTAMESAQTSVDTVQFADSISMIAGWMTGIMAAAMLTGYLASLLLGRWWQAILYNPGGLKKEFYGVRLGYNMGAAALAVAVIALVASGTIGNVAKDMLWVLGVIYLLPGLGVLHNWIGKTGNPTPWLVGLYILLVFIPHVTVMVAALGWTDTWINIRARIGKRDDVSGSGDE